MTHLSSTPRHGLRRVFAVLAIVCGLCCGSLRAQGYTSIVVFGDSLSDNGNDAAVSSAKYTAAAQVPGPATGYNNGRFTNGNDTVPTARLYTGVWIEQVAAQLTAHPVLTNSLASGTDYAYGFATTNTGTTLFTYGPGNSLSFSVNNMGQQVSDYLATKPTITSKTLFVVWGGANDLINATSSADIVNAATRDAGIIQTLISAGATDFVVPNLPPLGLVPRFNGSATTSQPATAAALGYNQALGAALVQLGSANAGKNLNIYSLDVATLFNTIVATPSNYGLADIKNSSQGNAAVNPDTYLFWDDLHPTTAGHHLIAATALRLLRPVPTTATLVSTNPTPNLNAAVTFTATVTSGNGSTDTPMGNVTFSDAGAPLGTAFLSGSGASATATFTTSTLAAGTHPISVSYNNVNGFGASISPFLSEVVTAPSYAASLTPATQTVSRAAGGSATLVITPAGGYTGTFAIACGTVPAHFSCTPQLPSLTVAGPGTVQTQIAFATNVASLDRSPLPGRNAAPIVAALLGLPLTAFALFSRRRSLPHLGIRLALVILFSSGFFFLNGCSTSDPFAHDAPVGSYQIPITVTPATGAAQTITLNVVVQ